MSRLFLLALAFPCGAALGEDLWSRLAAPGADRVRELFVDFSRVYRPPHGEEAARDWVLGIVDEARRRHWTSRGLGAAVTTAVDAAGNLLVRVPGTGRFTATPYIVALQSHLDMVLVAADSGADLATVFRNGVQVAETDGWLHSRDHRTTLGADDGIGVALALRYLVSPELEHPPLELVFTRTEEDGMVGARNFELPLSASILVNLDEEDDTSLCHAGMGSRRLFFEGTVPTEAIPSGNSLVSLSISGLAGGHSGLEIHRPRLNAIRVLAAILLRLQAQSISPRLLEIQSGREDRLSAIPSMATMLVAVPEALAGDVGRIATDVFRELLSHHRDESAEAALLTVGLNGFSRPRTALTTDATGRMADLLHNTPVGPLRFDSRYEFGISTSANLAFVSLSGTTARLGYMPRSFVASELDAASTTAVDWLRRNWPGGTPRLETRSPSPPWYTPPDSWQFLLAQSLYPRGKIKAVPGGLELSHLAAKFPQMAMMTIGPNIRGAHTPQEAVELASVRRIETLLDTLLIEFGQCRGRVLRPN